jgi:microcystin-dependent protein
LADPWLGEIKLLPFDFVPRSYAACDGALMSIAQNTALFSLIGATYGGDGRTTFALPDLRGRLPLQRIQPVLGEPACAAQISLSSRVASAAATSGVGTSVATRPNNRLLASTTSATYRSGAVNTTLDPASVVSAAPQSSIQPNFVIALVGAFPSRA